MENYLRAKAMIFKTERWLPQKQYKHKRYAFVNADDQNSEGFYDKTDKFELKTYSLQGRGDFNAEVKEITLDGSKFEYGGVLFSQSLVGEYNVYNCFLALLIYERLGYDLKSAVDAVQKLRSPKGRFEIFKTKSHGCVVVDFAHTPQSYEQLLRFAKKNIHGRIILVFGSAGLRDKTKRPLMGEVAARYADVLIITSEDPRTEKAADIGRAIIEGARGAGFDSYSENGRTEKVYYEEYDRRKAILLAVKISKQGDYVFVLGKGHEQTMCYGLEEQPWSDQLVVEEVIASVESVV
jgi:UDP-N-acetylmuramoyl-L-alanyl-D-glutamate--2,6-diaminopimelate ligase